jgi:hypothetical protein
MSHPGCKSKADTHLKQALDALKGAPEDVRKHVSAAFRFITEVAETHPELQCPYCSDPVALAAAALSAVSTDKK